MALNPHRPPDGRAQRRRLLGLELDPEDRQLLRDFADHGRRRGLRPAAIQKNDRVMRLIAEHVHPRRLVDATDDDIERFLDARKLSARTRYAYVSHAHGFFKWGVIYGRVPKDPTLTVVRPRFPNVIPKPIPDPDLEHAINIAGPRERAIIGLAAFHGLRAAEIAGLQREDILDRNEPSPVILIRDGKGGKQRVVPLHADAWERMIQPWCASHRAGWLFTNEYTGRQWNGWNVSNVINTLLHDAGIGSSLHCLRHYYGTKVYGASQDLRLVQGLLGHSSPNTTVGYVAWSSLDAAKAVSAIKLPGGQKFTT